MTASVDCIFNDFTGIQPPESYNTTETASRDPVEHLMAADRISQE